MILVAVIWIAYLFKKEKLSERVNRSTIIMRYRDYYFIHIYPSPHDRRILEDKRILKNKCSCTERKISLVRDAKNVMKDLPVGKYASVSHKSFLKKLKKAQRKEEISNLSAKPVYKSPNKRNILKLYGCRTCKDKSDCPTLNDSKQKIDFYYIEFTKTNGNSINEVELNISCYK